MCIPMSKKCVEDKTTGMRLMYVGMLLLYSHVVLVMMVNQSAEDIVTGCDLTF